MGEINGGESMRWLIICYLKTDYFTSYFLKQCKNNPNVQQGL